MFSRSLRRAVLMVLAAVVSISLPTAALAAKPASPPLIGTFPIGHDEEVLEPESSMCGFEILSQSKGTASFQVFFDEAGDPSRVQIHATWTGILSANGITLTGRSSLNQILDFQANTVVEVGLVFQNRGRGTGVVLMDRGRLVWSVDPETGDFAIPPLFEAGPHPQLHGDLGDLCQALTA